MGLNRARRGLGYIIAWLLQLPCPPSTRASLLRMFGAEVGPRTRVHRIYPINLEVAGLSNLKIGADCHIGPETLIDLAALVEILDRTTLSPRVTLLTHTDPGAAAMAIGKARRVGGVRVGPDAWVGAAAVLLPGAHVGARAIVGAGAVVTRSVPDGATVVGVPARPLQSQGELGEADGFTSST